MSIRLGHIFIMKHVQKLDTTKLGVLVQHSTFQMIFGQFKHIFVQEKKIEGKIKSHIYLRNYHILHRLLTQHLFLDKQYPS